MRLALFLALGEALTATSSSGQEQSTSAPCGPAIARVSGNVVVNCGIDDQREGIDRATRHLVGDHPITLNMPYPRYRKADLLPTVGAPAKLHRLEGFAFGWRGFGTKGSKQKIAENQNVRYTHPMTDLAFPHTMVIARGRRSPTLKSGETKSTLTH